MSALQTSYEPVVASVGVPFVQVDAFTDRPFTGNPAAVCLLPEARDARWMQAVATEMALAETAFVVRTESRFDLRWFTPAVEEELCGHATLASAHVLWESGLLLPEAEARFATRSGVLVAKQSDGFIELDFPTEHAIAVSPPPSLLLGLGMTPRFVGRNRLDYLVELDDEEAVRRAAPRMDVWASLDTRGVIVTSKAVTGGFDFISRFFSPREHAPEDPVTGSAHCALAPHWSPRLGKTEMTGYQASARGGVVKVRLRGERTSLLGQAVTVVRGEILV